MCYCHLPLSQRRLMKLSFSQTVSWQAPAGEQANPVLQGCIMISQGTIGCFSRCGASFLGLWQNSLCTLVQPKHPNASLRLEESRRICKASPCHSPTKQIQSNDTRSNFLAIARCQANWKSRVCLECGVGGQVQVADGGSLIGSGHVGESGVCACVRPCMCVCVCFVYARGSLCGVILENLLLWRGTDVDLHMWRVPSLWWD